MKARIDNTTGQVTIKTQDGNWVGFFKAGDVLGNFNRIAGIVGEENVEVVDTSND